MNASNYFAIWDVAVNEIIGDVWLTMILGLIIFYIVSAKFNFSYNVSILLGMIWILIFAVISQSFIMWALMVLFAGVLLYGVIASKLRKG